MKTVFAIVAALAFVAAFVAAEDPVAKDNAAEIKADDTEPEFHRFSHRGGNYGYRGGNYGGRRTGGDFGGHH